MNIHKQIIPVVAAMALFLLPHAEGGQPVYRIQAVVGDVQVIAGGAARPAAEGQALGGGDTVVTGKNSMADIAWGDRGLVRIDEKTRMSMASLSKGADDPDCELSSGGILVVISRLVSGESFQVKTRTQVASVRGTSFQVTADGEQSRLDVLTGRVMVHPVLDGRIAREFSEYVSERQSSVMNRSLAKDIIAKRRKIIVSALKDRDADGLVEKFGKIRESRGYRKLNEGLKHEINDRIMKIRERRGEGDPDRERIKEKLKKDRDQRQQRGERKNRGRGGN